MRYEALRANDPAGPSLSQKAGIRLCGIISPISTYSRIAMNRACGGVDVNERYLEILAQYDLTVDSVRKGRSGFICETSAGTVLLSEYRGTLKRLEFEMQVLSCVREAGMDRVDDYIRTAQGELIAVGEDGTRYVLKRWFTDPECNIRDRREVRLAVSQIARLHRILREIPRNEEWNLGSILTEPMEKELERHNQELKRARNYMKNKRKKTEFESCVLSNFQVFYEQAASACEGLRQLRQKESGAPLFLCHGNLDHHHILMGEADVAVIEFHRMHLGEQMEDLYYFMRKVMEKQDWNLSLGMEMLSAYERVLPISAAQRQRLYYLFLYPEKYWKQINFYFNANKAWIPARNIEKLRNLERQMEDRNRFLEKIR